MGHFCISGWFLYNFFDYFMHLKSMLFSIFNEHHKCKKACFLKKKHVFVEKTWFFTIYNVNHFSFISSIFEVDQMPTNFNIFVSNSMIFAKKTSFSVILSIYNRFLALKPLETVLRTSKHHFWEVHFWWPKSNLKSENRSKS